MEERPMPIYYYGNADLPGGEQNELYNNVISSVSGLTSSIAYGGGYQISVPGWSSGGGATNSGATGNRGAGTFGDSFFDCENNI